MRRPKEQSPAQAGLFRSVPENVLDLRQTARVTAPLDTAEVRKARGAFFTPEALSRYVTEWAVRTPEDRILEPSCGEAAFLLSAVERLAALRAAVDSDAAPQLHGVELHEESAASARALLRADGVEADIRVGDFFMFTPEPVYDAVIGNPPYVRYQDFSGESRVRSREAALRAGVAITNLASSWAAFTVHAALFLKKGGRLGLVVPAELLSVNYAAEVRRFLLERFARVDLVMFEERVFPGVLEEVVLLLADDYLGGPADHCHVVQAPNAAALSSTAVARSWKPEPPGGKWTPSLLSTEALSAYTSAVSADDFTSLETWGDTTLGMVTGNNNYFALSPARVAELGLPESDLVPLSPPGSRHLRGLSFTDSLLADMGQSGSATWLFRPPGDPSPASLAYIDAGHLTGVEKAYKCRVRQPWWRVPLLPPADLFLTYMNADTPRLCTNRAKVHHLNSVHGVYLRPEHRRVGKDLLPLAALNSMTLLGAETVGRAYGGGMLKIEPREADLLPVPSPGVVQAARAALSAIRGRMITRLRSARLLDAAALVDDVLLIGELGMSRTQVRALRDGHADLSARRTARGNSVVGD